MFDSRHRRFFFFNDDDVGATRRGKSERERQSAEMSAANVGASIR